jgi:hypothetical protein
MSPQKQSGYGRRLEDMRTAIAKSDVAGALIAAGDVLRRTHACNVTADVVKGALTALDSEKVKQYVASLDAEAMHGRLNRGLEDAFEALLCEDNSEREEWSKEATKALLERDGLESARVACECTSGRIEALDAKIAAVDAGLAKKAICLVALNDFRRDELSQLDPEARDGAWWFAARCHCETLGEMIAGRKPFDPALVTDPEDAKLIRKLAGIDVPPKRVDGESLWLQEVGAASKERAKWAERHVDAKDKKALDTDIE